MNPLLPKYVPGVPFPLTCGSVSFEPLTFGYVQGVFVTRPPRLFCPSACHKSRFRVQTVC